MLGWLVAGYVEVWSLVVCLGVVEIMRAVSYRGMNKQDGAHLRSNQLSYSLAVLISQRRSAGLNQSGCRHDGRG